MHSKLYLCKKNAMKSRLLTVMVILLAWFNRVQAAPEDSVKVLPDSSNFVTASLLVAEPLHALYSVFGHAMLRMECPVHGLDYVFTFESDPNFGTFLALQERQRLNM